MDDQIRVGEFVLLGQLPPHGRMSGMAIIEAAAALEAGLCDYAALIYANIGRSRRVNYGGDENPGVWDPWGFTSPGAAHAMMFQRHRALYGTTTRQLAEVSVAFRHHATLNPNASLITGVICGVRVEGIEDPLMREIRYLDKLIDELAKGRPMEKILR